MLILNECPMNSIVQTVTPALETSKDFYTKLNFAVSAEGDTTYATDSNVAIEINNDRFARAGLKLYKESWEEQVTLLREQTHVLSIDGGYLLSDPSNTWIYLMEGSGPNVQLGNEASILGNYAGFSLEMVDMAKGVEIYKTLGFEGTGGDPSQGWMALKNSDEMVVSLMQPNTCPHLFFNPSLTYFNGKEGNPKVIQALRDRNIPFAEEITHFNKEGLVDNVIVRDPGGFGFFVFND